MTLGIFGVIVTPLIQLFHLEFQWDIFKTTFQKNRITLGKICTYEHALSTFLFLSDFPQVSCWQHLPET